MLLEGSNAKSTRLIPQFNFSFACACGDEFAHWGYGFSIMGESFLVYDVALWLPFPYDDLAIILDSQGNPGAWIIDS